MMGVPNLKVGGNSEGNETAPIPIPGATTLEPTKDSAAVTLAMAELPESSQPDDTSDPLASSSEPDIPGLGISNTPTAASKATESSPTPKAKPAAQAKPQPASSERPIIETVSEAVKTNPPPGSTSPTTLEPTKDSAEASPPPDPPQDIYIAVMGQTGTGKTSFIQDATGKKLKVGHTLRSCMQPFSLNNLITRENNANPLIP